ncbi:MAG: transposase [Cyanobacteria bacterium SW_9_44_58]|nr:MAG: transposase [Cyanobacteria bacterium SW_9_44_58]
MMILNYTYRIYPNNQQAQLLDEWLETLRLSYNHALRELKDWIASRKCPIDRCSLESEYIMSADYPFPSYHQQQNNLPKAKKDFPRLKSVPSQVLQTNIRRLHDAWDFFRHRGYGFPRFKKMGQMKSFLFPQFRTNPITGWHIQLPKLGKVEVNLHRPIPDGFTIRQIRIVKKAKGWFAIITLYADVEIPSPSPRGRAIGVDVGLLSYLATSDGFIEPGRKFFKTEQSRLKVLQRRLAKKQKRSKNYEKARQKVEKQHNHIAFKRKDYQFKLAHKLCDMADTIFLEDIDFRTMAKGFLGKHSLDAGFGQFRTILNFVGGKRDVFVGEVDHRGTSQTCPNCRITVKKKLSDRKHSCPECLYEVDRDVASAQEICNRGIETYRGTPEKQEIGSQVEVSGAMCLDNWRRGAMLIREDEKPALYR